MFLLETPTFSLTIPEWVLVFGHSISGAIYITSANFAPIISSMIVSSLIFSLEIPATIFLQFTIFSGIQKQQTNGLDILGGCLILVAVTALPCVELLQEKCKIINRPDKNDQLTDEAMPLKSIAK